MKYNFICITDLANLKIQNATSDFIKKSFPLLHNLKISIENLKLRKKNETYDYN